MRVAIISHTEHYLENNTIVGWGPTVNEINYLVKNKQIKEVIHIAPLHKNNFIKGSLSYHQKVSFVALKPSGGKGIGKLSILLRAPLNILKIHKALKNVDVIQFRAPTGMGIYVLPYLRFFNNKKYWVKYAGNWKDSKMPLGNKFQKKWLQNLTKLKTKITVNGIWNNERSNVLSFENPCLDSRDRIEGKQIIADKKMANKINFCFVGALNKHKGVDKIIEAFKILENKKIGEIHFVGDSNLKEHFINASKSINKKIIFHGFLPKNAIKEVYAKCHFLILPSKSEGFPKVVSEAMNFGCIPIVSDVSCVNQYIKDNNNGFLIKPNTINNLVFTINKVLTKDNNYFKKCITYNYKNANKFTYQNYIERISKEIFY